jgi:hypothetical protein
MSNQNQTHEQTVTADQTPSNVPPRPQSADNPPRTSHTCCDCNFVATNQRELFYHNLKCPTAGELSPEALNSPKSVQPKDAKSGSKRTFSTAFAPKDKNTNNELLSHNSITKLDATRFPVVPEEPAKPSKSQSHIVICDFCADTQADLGYMHMHIYQQHRENYDKWRANNRRMDKVPSVKQLTRETPLSHECFLCGCILAGWLHLKNHLLVEHGAGTLDSLTYGLTLVAPGPVHGYGVLELALKRGSITARVSRHVQEFTGAQTKPPSVPPLNVTGAQQPRDTKSTDKRHPFAVLAKMPNRNSVMGDISWKVSQELWELSQGTMSKSAKCQVTNNLTRVWERELSEVPPKAWKTDVARSLQAKWHDHEMTVEVPEDTDSQVFVPPRACDFTSCDLLLVGMLVGKILTESQPSPRAGEEGTALSRAVDTYASEFDVVKKPATDGLKHVLGGCLGGLRMKFAAEELERTFPGFAKHMGKDGGPGYQPDLSSLRVLVSKFHKTTK